MQVTKMELTTISAGVHSSFTVTGNNSMQFRIAVDFLTVLAIIMVSHYIPVDLSATI